MKTVLRIAALIALTAWSGTAAANTFSLTIVNKTGSVLEAFYTSPVGEDDWEEDMLGDEVIAPGKQKTIRFKDDRNVCKYDMRFEFGGGDLEPLEDTQNLCDLGTYTITE
ncbi:hypothetical protein P7L74_22095 [Tistrella mobilis]|uniref:hypothetical protein n=1 Tax=Tistrella mobilis TaxID=171437 RepID=UPI003557D752